MVTLILLLLLCLVFGVFVAQNTMHVTVTFFNLLIKDVPLYLLMIIPLITGLVIGWIISLFGSLSHVLTLRKKDSTINEKQQSVDQLTNQLMKLEAENADLKEKLHRENEAKDTTL